MPNPENIQSNSTLHTIANRHSIRMFAEKDVSETDMLAMLTAANAAPSAHNQQSWKFVTVRGNKKRELVELVNHQAGSFPRSAALLLRMAARSMASAPVVVAVTNTGELVEHGKRMFELEGEQAHDFLRTMEIQSSAAAVQNLLLAATSLGLGSVWLGILFLIKDPVLRFLGEPKGEFMAVIPVGHPARSSKGPIKRPLENTIKLLE